MPYLSRYPKRGYCLGIRLAAGIIFLAITLFSMNGLGNNYAPSQQQVVLKSTNSTVTCPSEPIANLGCTLFFDKRFSRDHTISCGSCHRPDLAFADGKAKAEGIEGQTGTRNTPSLFNASYTQDKFWDGRRTSLTEQVLDPFTNPREHGLDNQDQLLGRFKAAEDYTNAFIAAFNQGLSQATANNLAQALTAYVISLKPQGTTLDRFLAKQDKSALSAAEKNGLELFRGRAQCANCHTLDDTNASLTDGSYHNRGVGFRQVMPRLAKLTKTITAMPSEDRTLSIGNQADIAALGRFVATLQPADIGKFKTPSLREVAATAPYMHDGSLATLEQAVDWELYYQGQGSGHPIGISQTERADLLAFLRALTSQHNSPSSGAPKLIVQGKYR